MRLRAICHNCIKKAEAILQLHPAIRDSAVRIFHEMFASGITLLKQNGVSLNQEVEDEGDFEEEALPANAVPMDKSVTQSSLLECFLSAQGGDKNAAHITCNGTKIHVPQLVNYLFNSHQERAS